MWLGGLTMLGSGCLQSLPAGEAPARRAKWRHQASGWLSIPRIARDPGLSSGPGALPPANPGRFRADQDSEVSEERLGDDAAKNSGSAAGPPRHNDLLGKHASSYTRMCGNTEHIWCSKFDQGLL